MSLSKLPGYEVNNFRDHDGDYRSGVAMESPKMALYALQKQVEHLPVPPLEDTLSLYLHSIVPLVSPQEFVKTKAAVDKFRSSIGPVLQQRLQKRAEELNAKGTSWFAKWWNEYGYVGYRDTIVHNVTYYLQFADELPHAMDPRRRAARFVHHGLKFRKQVIYGTLSPDMRKGNKPMSNTQWKFLFNACRMPDQPTDFVRTYAGDVYQHLVVVRKNRFFKIDIFDSNGQELSIDAWEAQFNRVVRYADSLGADPNPIGILTSNHRDAWYEHRKLLINSQNPAMNAVNEASLEAIQSSIFVLCFDETTPVTREETGRELLHSNGKNRFWDKSFQMVFFENGKGGYVGEHSMTDGLTTTRFVNGTLEKVFADADDVKLPAATVLPYSGSTTLTEPQPLPFRINEMIAVAISSAICAFDELVSSKELKVLMFHGYGKNKIKTFKCSPDAFAQVAIQLAYYKTFGFCKATYESTQTRSFLHGRTEVTRSCSIDSLKFSRKIVDSPKHAASLKPTYEKEAYELMMNAINAHVKYIGKASKGLGCDRHLLGLKFLLEPGEDDSFFKDPAYARSGHWALSTSGLVGEKMNGWGFGEVVPDGLGIGYSVLKDQLRFTVTSRHHWAGRFVANVEQSLLEMQYLAEKFTTKTRAKL